jgi:hypothetical protein
MTPLSSLLFLVLFSIAIGLNYGIKILAIAFASPVRDDSIPSTLMGMS